MYNQEHYCIFKTLFITKYPLCMRKWCDDRLQLHRLNIVDKGSQIVRIGTVICCLHRNTSHSHSVCFESLIQVLYNEVLMVKQTSYN